ncbi:hypothetical protein [Alicyclobacillus hesperidum]|uniref:hypothetical protein n=1 Tax=Alicyclobacillus hesperidum TaxID=89784 RepID=UPI000B14DE36|nr:hypothetical protein [Alicyclobacillus hesperidum]
MPAVDPDVAIGVSADPLLLPVAEVLVCTPVAGGVALVVLVFAADPPVVVPADPPNAVLFDDDAATPEFDPDELFVGAGAVLDVPFPAALVKLELFAGGVPTVLFVAVAFVPVVLLVLVTFVVLVVPVVFVGELTLTDPPLGLVPTLACVLEEPPELAVCVVVDTFGCDNRGLVAAFVTCSFGDQAGSFVGTR